MYGEREGGRDIYPEADGSYRLFEDDDVAVFAAPMQHSVPCVGFVFSEKPKPGRLKIEEIKPLVDANMQEIRNRKLFRDPRKIFALLKDLQPDDHYTLPDGTVLYGRDIVEPPREGRKVVIMGDTCNGDHIKELARGADVVVHEATNAYFKGISRFTRYVDQERDTFIHGHSTPEMAGRFCRSIGAQSLLLTHFSPRYRGDDSFDSMRLMWRIEDMARSTSGLWGRNQVVAAWDGLEINIPRKGSSVSVEGEVPHVHSKRQGE